MDNRQYEDSLYLEENSYSRYINARSQQPQDLVVKFINYCATLLQKNIKGFQQRSRHKIIMMHIRRFKSLLNAHISGYKIRKILKLNDVNNLKQDILETDDGTYGNPQVRQKKIKLIRCINQHFETGSYAKLKKQRSTKHLSTKPFAKKPFQQQSNFQEIDNGNNIPNLDLQNRPQKRQFQSSNQNTIVQNQSSSDFNNIDRQYQYSKSQQNYQNYEDYSQIKPKNNYNNFQETDYSANLQNQQLIVNKYQETDRSIQSNLQDDRQILNKPQQLNYDDDRPITSKPQQNYVNYDDDRPIISKPQQNYVNYDDDRPITSKPQQNYVNYDDDRPITSKPKQNYTEIENNPQWEDEKPLNNKSQNLQKDNILKNKKKKSIVKKLPQNYDEQIENEFTTPSEDRPIQAKGQYTYEEQEIKQEIENEFNNTDKPKKKKQDPKAIENLKKRTKYDPRKAIEDAKKKQELEQQEAPQEEEIVKQPIKKLQGTPKKRDKTPEITKTPPKQIINNQEASPRDELNSSFDNKPKNFLKRKSKQVPLNNPKMDPKAIKSKVKNCWNGEEGEVDVSEDVHMSPKAYVNTKSPSKKFLEKTEKPTQSNLQQYQKQQQQQQDQKQYKQQQGQYGQQQQQQKQSRVISLDELEKAYNVNYSQKFESTMKNLQNIIEQRIKIPQGVPVISNKSRFYQSFKLSEFDHVLNVLEDQYNKLQQQQIMTKQYIN